MIQEFHKIPTILEKKQVSPISEDNSSIGSIATSVIANKVEKMERKDACKYSLKQREG